VAGPVPAGFDPAAIRAGLLKAMVFGKPARESDQALFVIPAATVVDDGEDDEGVSFDPTDRDVVAPRELRVDCAVEYVDATGSMETAGVITPSKVIITLLDEEYQQVKGFSHVIAGGDTYRYSKTPPPDGLGTMTIWTVICVADDET
jgi:hypothetical protein